MVYRTDNCQMVKGMGGALFTFDLSPYTSVTVSTIPKLTLDVMLY